MPSAIDESARILSFGRFELDRAKRRLARDGKPIALTPKAFDLLMLFVERNGQLLAKDEIMQAIWPDSYVEETNLTSNISRLRKILDVDGVRYIETRSKHGYCFTADVESRPSGDNTMEDPGADERSTTERSTANSRMRRIALVSLLVLACTIAALLTWQWPISKGGAVAGGPIRSLAILPLKPLVADQRDEALEMGLADTLITRFAAEGSLAVRPLAAVRRFAGLQQDPLSAGRALGVDSVLDGSIYRSGDRIRVNARLIRVIDGSTIWAATFDEKMTGLFDVQDTIAEKVAAALSFEFSSDKRAQEARRSTDDTEAYQQYLRGRYHGAKLTLVDNEKAIEYYLRAIEIDPQYALAYAGLADAYLTLPLSSDLAPNEYFPKARAAAQRAIEIDDQLTTAYATLGWVALWYDWDLEEAEMLNREAAKVSPDDPDVRRFYAHVLSNSGHHEEALAEMELALKADPLNLRTLALYGQFLLHAGKLDESIASLRATADLESQFWLTHLFLASAYIEKGLFTDAIAETRLAGQLSVSLAPRAFEAVALAKMGKPDEAQEILKQLIELRSERFVPPHYLAMISNALGNTDDTFRWLEEAYASRDAKMSFLLVEPKWKNLHSDARYQSLLLRMGFEPQASGYVRVGPR
ncbi:MAG TPA: winged helix-turn-helix domain-containing protein [Woeseiaceae bacterium]|nr:winged helix-turn-helix domain-containing protein [Woeseiaceae bacterium]